MGKPMRIFVLALLALLLFTLAGCGLVAKKAVETATGVKVDQNGQNGQNITVTGQNGQKASVSSQEGKLPDGLPSDVPAYGGTIKTAAAIATDKGTNYQFTIETGDDVSAVQSWYKDKLTANGWTVVGTVAGGTQSAMVQAKKGDKATVLVTIGKDSSSGKTQIAVIADVLK